MTLGINDTQHNNALHYAERRYAECCIFYGYAECRYAEYRGAKVLLRF